MDGENISGKTGFPFQASRLHEKSGSGVIRSHFDEVRSG
jgi:hypothetical protein